MFPHCRLIRIGLLFGLALGLSACTSSATPGPTATPQATLTPVPPTATAEPLALTVNGEGITVVEFNAAVQRYLTSQQSLGKTVSSQDASNVVKEDLIAQLLLARGAHTNGFVLDEAALQARLDALAAQVGGADGLAAWEAAHGYTDQAFRSELKRTAEAAWMRDKILAEVPKTAEQVHVQQILLYNEDQAQSFLMQLNGGADFDELALKADPQTRGDLGWVPRGYLLEPKIEEAAFALAVGQHSEIISTGAGFHIIRVLERDPQRPLSPDAYLALQEQALKAWIQQQRQQANITFAEQP